MSGQDDTALLQEGCAVCESPATHTIELTEAPLCHYHSVGFDTEPIEDHPTAIDLFCGAGGASCGIEQGGFELVAGIDVDESALESHSENLPGEHIKHDLRVVDPSILPTKKVDWVHGSPPCQGFSKANNNADPTDGKNELVWSFLNWVDEINPRYVTIENVPEMKAHSSSLLDEITSTLKRCGDGFRVKWRRLNAADYGVPQTRKRIYFIAYRSDQPLPEEWFPSPTHSKTPTSTLDGGSLSQWRTVRDALGPLDGIPENAAENPSCTITSRPYLLRRGHGTVTGRSIYKLSIRESLRLQSFPDYYTPVGTATERNRQIGNSIPPRQMEHIASHLRSHLVSQEAAVEGVVA